MNLSSKQSLLQNEWISEGSQICSLMQLHPDFQKWKATQGEYCEFCTYLSLAS